MRRRIFDSVVFPEERQREQSSSTGHAVCGVQLTRAIVPDYNEHFASLNRKAHILLENYQTQSVFPDNLAAYLESWFGTARVRIGKVPLDAKSARANLTDPKSITTACATALRPYRDR